MRAKCQWVTHNKYASKLLDYYSIPRNSQAKIESESNENKEGANFQCITEKKWKKKNTIEAKQCERVFILSSVTLKTFKRAVALSNKMLSLLPVDSATFQTCYCSRGPWTKDNCSSQSAFIACPAVLVATENYLSMFWNKYRIVPKVGVGYLSGASGDITVILTRRRVEKH